MSNPKLSIITITYNAEDTLERTIKSVEIQDYPYIEYIIVDGKSKDGTMSIVEKHSRIIDKVISEPDDGLYYAMNKGLELATGDYVWFMNAGDEIYDKDTVSRMFGSAHNADVLYGDTIMTDMAGNIIGERRLAPPQELTWKSFKKGMLVSHQSFVARKALCSKYDTKYRFSADFDWCVEILKRSQTIVNTNTHLSKFLDGGITKQNIIPGLKERFTIMTKHYGLTSTLLHHIPIAIKFFRYWLTQGRF